MRWRRPRKYAGQEWASSDARKAGLLFLLLVLAMVFPNLVVVIAALMLLQVLQIVVHVVRRRRLQRRTDRTSEFWADRIRPPE